MSGRTEGGNVEHPPRNFRETRKSARRGERCPRECWHRRSPARCPPDRRAFFRYDPHRCDHQPGVAIDAEAVAAIRHAVSRRATGEPVHRILGFRHFYGLRLFLSPETLEPRPDTETLVDAVLPFLRQTAAREGICRILDLWHRHRRHSTGSASGSAASHGRRRRIRRMRSPPRAGMPAKTAFRGRFQAVRSDWFEKISAVFHVIVANPPYIPTNELATLQGEVRNFDPARALDGGADGLDAYRTIAEQAKAYLEPTGRVAVEIGHTQKEDVSRLFQMASFQVVEARKDLAGHERVLVFGRG